MRTMKNIGLIALGVLLIASVISFAETGRLGSLTEPSFNVTKSVTKTAAYTVLASDSQVRVTTSSANIVITLPSVASVVPQGGARYKIIKTDATAYKVVVTPASGDTIGGESTRYLISQNAYMIISAGPGGDWRIEYETPFIVEDHEAGTYTTGIGSGGLYSAKTTSTTLTASDCGNLISLNTGTLTTTLPATVANCRYKFVNNTTGQTQIIKPNASDSIWGIVPSTATVYSMSTLTKLDAQSVTMSLNSSGPGAVFEIMGDGVDGWIITAATYSVSR